MEILATVLGIIISVGTMYGLIRKSMRTEIKEPIEYRIDKLTKCECKNFLVQFLNDKENGVQMNFEYEKRAHEIKDKAKKLEVNSYIANKWQKVMGEQW